MKKAETTIGVSKKTARKLNELKYKYNFQDADQIVKMGLKFIEKAFKKAEKDLRKAIKKDPRIPNDVKIVFGVEKQKITMKDIELSDEELERIAKEYGGA